MKNNMRQMFVKYITVVKKQITAPFLQKTFKVAIISVGAVEAKKAFIAASNSSLSLPVRRIAAVKGTCSTGALVTSYFATRTPNPGLAATFRVCCGIFSSGYMLAGGDTATALSFIYSSTFIEKK